MAKGTVNASEEKVMIRVWDVSAKVKALAWSHQTLLPNLPLLLTLQP